MISFRICLLTINENVTSIIKLTPQDENTSKRKKCDVSVRTKIMKLSFLHNLLHGIDSTMCNHREYPIMLKCHSNNASNPLTGIQGYTVTMNNHLTSLKAVELRSLVHYGFIEPKDNRTCFAHKSYLAETVDLC